METTNKNQIEFTRIDNDTNGNPRFVCHFLAFTNESDDIKADTKGIGAISAKYDLALSRARQLGGKKFHNKQYGGGIVFQMYSGEQSEMSDKINALKNTNTNFIQEWQPFDKVYKMASKAILRHFQAYTYKWQPNHNEESRKDFYPYSFDDIDTKLGLAYTSTSAYAGLWVCNGGYMWASDTHFFTGFAVNELGQVIGIVQDENENEIFIEL